MAVTESAVECACEPERPRARPTVAFVAANASPGLATVIAAASDPSRDVRLALQRVRGSEDNEHEVGMIALGQAASVASVSLGGLQSVPIDRLFVALSHTADYDSASLGGIRELLARARSLVLLYTGQFGTRSDLFRAQLRMMTSYSGMLRRASLVCYMLRPPGLDAFSWKKRRPLSVGPNVHCLFDPAARARLYSQERAPRRYRIVATGAKYSDPFRSMLCDSLAAMLSSAGEVRFCTDAQRKKEGTPSVLWTVGAARRLPLDEYYEVLGAAAFVICLPGTSWTHRPFEALVRGAIPILDAVNARMHDIPWRDGENCIMVHRPFSLKNWCEAVASAVSMPADRVASMQAHVDRLRATHTDFERFRARLWRRVTGN
jgi:hypothetical protein